MRNFSSIDDFKSFVANLPAKEIQGWSTEDWLGLYAEIDRLVLSQKNFPRFSDFINKECCAEFTKLYTNYRFDPEEFKILRQMGNQVGKDLATRGKIDLASVLENSAEILPQMTPLIDAVQPVSQMPHHPTMVTEWGDLFDSVRGSASYFNIRLYRNKLQDNTLFITAHEAAHALLQHDREEEDNFVRRKLAHSDAFSLLMSHNHTYYLKPSSEEEEEEEGKTIDKEKAKEIHHAYMHQPIEKHANFFGYFCDRAFRQNAGQPSERCAMKLMQILGKPLKAHYEDKHIIMDYPLDKLSALEAISIVIPAPHLQYETNKDTVSLRVKPDFITGSLLRKLQENKFKIGTDLTLQQYFDHPFWRYYTSLPEHAKLPQTTDLSKHPYINLDAPDCQDCREIIFPRAKFYVNEFHCNKISDTRLPPIIDCDKSNMCFLRCDFSQVTTFSGPHATITIREAALPPNFDFSGVGSIKFENVDLRNSEQIKWPSKITSLSGCKLPETVDFSAVKSINLCGADLSATKSIKLPPNIDNIVISKEMLDKYHILQTAVTAVKEMKKMKDRLAQAAPKQHRKSLSVRTPQNTR